MDGKRKSVTLRFDGSFLHGPWSGGALWVDEHGMYWEAHGVDGYRLPEKCATAEQALAVLIRHAAPWIAQALMEAEEP